jgi:predicted adenine nucleotide alpha hydrolase (AANH) superfamily ATPase
MTKAESKQTVEAGILADLRDPRMTYLEIAYRNKVGYNRVVRISKEHNLTRVRGRKKSSLLTVAEV